MRIKRTKLDDLMSRYIRHRDGWQCQRCGNSFSTGARGLHCHHFYTRRKLTVRWDPENCISVCHGCHSWFHGNPIESVHFMKKRLGDDKLEALRIRANTVGKKPDLELIHLDLENRLRGVK